MNPYSRISAKITKQTKNKITITKQHSISARDLTVLCEGGTSTSTPLIMAQLSLAKVDFFTKVTMVSTVHITVKDYTVLSMTMVHK